MPDDASDRTASGGLTVTIPTNGSDAAEGDLAVSDADTGGLDLAHRAPGRLRLRLARIAADREFSAALASQIEASPEIESVRVNRGAASIVVRYPRARSEHSVRALLAECIRSADSAEVRRPWGRPAAGRWKLTLPAILVGLAGLGRIVGLTLPVPVVAATIALAAAPIARRAAHGLRAERRLNIDALDLTAIALSTLRGSFLTPAVMIGMVEIGEAIRERTARASHREALDLLAAMAPVVWVDEGAGGRRQIPIDEVRPGDTLVVYPGDRIPVDGRVLVGTGLVDEHQLTGESMPVRRTEGELVYASTLLREGHLHVAVEHVGEETRAGRILRVMKEAPLHDTRIENYAAKVADRAVLPAFLLSGLMLAVTRDPTRAASILITDFITGIRVSVPTAVLASVTQAAQRGILIRSGRALEQLATIDAVVFDKTGTVTVGEPVINSVVTVGKAVSTSRLLALAASAEQRLTHPVAEAVVRYARDHGVRPGRRSGWQYHIGLGVRAHVAGGTVLVGSDRLLHENDVDLTRFHERSRRLRTNGDSLVYVAYEGELCGVMSYADPLRTESADVVSELAGSHAMDIHLLTGDKISTAGSVGRTLGIDAANTHAELFPEDKAAVVRDLHAEGKRVAFVGDGINDLPALAYSDVSVSFGGASDVARETADIVLMDGNLRGLPEAIGMAKHAMRLIRQNIGFVAGTNLGALLLTTTRGLDPVTAAVIHNGSTVAAAVNGLRPLLGGGRELAQ